MSVEKEILQVVSVDDVQSYEEAEVELEFRLGSPLRLFDALPRARYEAVFAKLFLCWKGIVHLVVGVNIVVTFL